MVNEAWIRGGHHPKRPGLFALAAAMSFVLAGAVSVSPSLAGPSTTDALNGKGFLESRNDQEREKAIGLLAAEMEAGISDLRVHYMSGGETPLPRALGIEYLLHRSQATGNADLRDLALGTSAVYVSMNLNDYLNHGVALADSEATRTVENAVDKAEILSILALAWRSSGSDMFRKQALRAGSDLVLDNVKKGQVVSFTVFPDTTAGPPLDVAGRTKVAAALLEAGLVFEQPDWVAAARAIDISGAASGGTAEFDVARRLEVARRLLFAISAAAGQPDLSWNKGIEDLAGELRRLDPAGAAVEPVSAGLSGLALMRYAAWAHDDSARDQALRIVGSLPAPEAKPENRNPDLFEAQAAAALTLEMADNATPMAYIVADPKAPATEALVRAALQANRPGRLVAVHDPKEPDLLYPGTEDGTPIVYVCSGELCAPPVDSPADVKTLLETFGRPESEATNPEKGSAPR